MDQDRTVLIPRGAPTGERSDRAAPAGGTALQVRVLEAGGGERARFVFTHGFTAGRAADNAVVIESALVSRHHLAVRWEDGQWWIQDTNSTNGVFVGGTRVDLKAGLQVPAVVLLGTSGIELEITRPGQLAPKPATAPRPHPPADAVAAPPPPATHGGSDRNLSPDQIRARLLAEHEAPDAGEYTRMVRRVIREDRSKRGRRYKGVIWVLVALFVTAAGLVAYQQIALTNARRLAIEMFYDIKVLEVSLAQADMRLEESAQVLERTMKTVAQEKLRVEKDRIQAEQEMLAAEKRRLEQEQEKLKQMKARYRQYVQEANALRFTLPTAARYEAELIARVARAFGESELELPAEFVAEVRRYIQYWQGSARLRRGIDNLERNNYAPLVLSALEQERLPAHFLYLPLQESNYENQAIGPETRFGIAKGAWQLLATTAQDYGLTPGPLAAVREFDERDDRFDFGQATRAAAKHLRRIYGTEAQASGLLVLASYNYGHGRMRTMIREMPDNPRERNFWKFIGQYELPKETYDYVFYIFSAAVIGEDPKHFGFPFQPPLLVQ
jgi:pSer/pThr/pTyr-binding forkhead associated (FHA) protein